VVAHNLTKGLPPNRPGERESKKNGVDLKRSAKARVSSEVGSRNVNVSIHEALARCSAAASYCAASFLCKPPVLTPSPRRIAC